MSHVPLPDLILEPLVRAALMEDLGTSGDITTRTVIPVGTSYAARLNAREAGVLSGLQVAALAFRLVDPALKITVHKADGDTILPGDLLMEITGNAASILSGERVALNFAGRMSGTATRVTCTRKTTPGLRIVEKQAVLHGGGFNHRFSLSDAILIKDNHIAAAKGIRPVLQSVKAQASHMIRCEIEVDRLDQLAEVLDEGGADVVLLDNMDAQTLVKAVEMTAGRVILEASGNMKLDRIAEVAATGADYISSGALTHSAQVLDLGLDF
ncbi:MAG: nicotinate-nucleotide diphosphorylase (carboxylating) [Rhodobacteraceae bacterium]|nr:nicotinate-nucleotide diphosphorylase (carboxylating) [Paracoccaceae bacterium]